jgi:signal transduction histidine kinase/CheY-like chemotaxis protein
MPAGRLEPLSHAPAPWRYVGAIALVWGAVLIRTPLEVAAARAAYLTVYPAVMLASLVLGEGPGIAGALVGVFLVERGMPGGLHGTGSVIRVAVVLFAAVLVGRVAQKAREAKAKLNRADARKSEFIAVLSHELRNPLAAMRNALHILDGTDHQPAQVERSRQILERQVHHLSMLVDDLLDVTRISRGKVQLHRVRIDVREVAARSVEDQRGLAGERGLTISLVCGAEPIPADADPIRLSQIVGNLLGNSIKFTERGGQIDVTVTRRESEAVLTVRDTGTGISPQLISEIFEPFTQADKSLHRTRGGLGLGLSVVKGLVELHGGRIEARSEGTGHGTEMKIILPLSDGPVPVPTLIPPPTLTPAPVPRRILIIEDNADAADTLQEILQRRGHTAEVARDGEQGIAKARAFRPDVVLCDIGLPGIDGFGVARAIRADPLVSRTYLVALTGYALPDDQRRAHEAGFDRHIAKPVMPGDVDQAIASSPSPDRAGATSQA